jgi:imidazolonepropionase-like amidohydrolase
MHIRDPDDDFPGSASRTCKRPHTNQVLEGAGKPRRGFVVTHGKQMNKTLFTTAVLFMALGAAVPGQCQSTLTVILADKAFTGREFVEDVAIIINGGVIRDVVPIRDYVPPEGARVLDAKGMTVTPGFIDSHVHVLGQPVEIMKKTAQRGWGRLAEEAISQVPGNREQLLKCGITTVIDMGSTLPGMLGLAEGLRSGKLLGPRLYYCGPLFTAPGGHPAGTTYRGQHELIDNATVQVDAVLPALSRVDQLAGQGVSFIKLVYDDGTFYGKKVPRLDTGLAAQITAEAHSRSLPVIAHLGAREESFSDMVSCGVDGVEHCFAYNGSDAAFRDAAARGVVFTPTLSIYEIYAAAVMPRMMQSVAKAHENGVIIAAGSDFPSTKFVTAGEGFYRELALLEEAGLSRAEVLEAATANGATKIGKDGEIGGIAPGRAADLLVFSGDIQEGRLDAGRIRRVILQGKDVVVDGMVPADSQKGLRRQPIMIFPFGFYDALSGFSAGASFLDFNLLGTGAAIGLTATYGFINCSSAELAVSSPSPIPATALDVRLSYDGYPKRFFGISNATALQDALPYAWTALEASVDASTTLVPTVKVTLTPMVEYCAIGSYKGSSLPGMTGDAGGFMTLVQTEIAHDTRDSSAAPWYGDYEAISAGISNPCIGSAFSFFSLDADIRYFLSVEHHHVLAARLLVKNSFGNPPFYVMPSFGGMAVGRGFQRGRFIGMIGAFGQLEYRFPIWSIIGGDLFLDSGQVCADYRQLSLDAFHFSGGAGLRFAFSERSILSVDVGFNGEPISGEGLAVIVRSGHAF